MIRESITQKPYIRECIPSDNGSHDFNNPHHDKWCEWWYANFHDPKQDIQGTIIFKINKDFLSDNYPIGSVTLSLIDHDLPPLYETFSIDHIKVKNNSCFVSMGKNSLQINPDLSYTISIESKDKNINVHLSYKPLTKGFTVAFEEGYWTVPVPSAIVSGTINYIKHNCHMNISGTGYLDRNWGSFDEDKIEWDWAEMSSPQHNLSIIFGQVRSSLPNQKVLVATDKNGIVAQLCNDNIDFKYNQFSSNLTTKKS